MRRRGNDESSDARRGGPDAGRDWELLAYADTRPRDVPAMDEAWADLLRHLDDPAPAPRARPRTRPARRPDRAPAARRLRRVWVSAALAVLLAAVGLWGWRLPVTVGVPPGGRATVVLPDGSHVELHGGSRLRYRRGFARWPGVADAERRVTLQGEAFFEVSHDGRSFTVETASARVEVLGTRFDVQAWPGPGAASTRVTLASGRVRAVPAGGGHPGVVLAKPGETTRIVSGRAAAPPAVEQADLDHALAWRQGGFYVVDQPVRAVLQELERAFGVTVETAPGLSLTDSLSLLYQQDATADAIIQDLCAAQGWHVRRTRRGYALSEGPVR